MDTRHLYDQCVNCRYAHRSGGGTPVGCFIQKARINEITGDCGDYAFWWTRPPKSERLKNAALVVGGIILLLSGLTVTLITLGIAGFFRVLKWVAAGITVNKDNLGLYFPKWRK